VLFETKLRDESCNFGSKNDDGDGHIN